jgi:hypothetical protein
MNAPVLPRTRCDPAAIALLVIVASVGIGVVVVFAPLLSSRQWSGEATAVVVETSAGGGNFHHHEVELLGALPPEALDPRTSGGPVLVGRELADVQVGDTLTCHVDQRARVGEHPRTTITSCERAGAGTV